MAECSIGVDGLDGGVADVRELVGETGVADEREMLRFDGIPDELRDNAGLRKVWLYDGGQMRESKYRTYPDQDREVSSIIVDIYSYRRTSGEPCGPLGYPGKAMRHPG